MGQSPRKARQKKEVQRKEKQRKRGNRIRTTLTRKRKKARRRKQPNEQLNRETLGGCQSNIESEANQRRIKGMWKTSRSDRTIVGRTTLKEGQPVTIGPNPNAKRKEERTRLKTSRKEEEEKKKKQDKGAKKH